MPRRMDEHLIDDIQATVARVIDAMVQEGKALRRLTRSEIKVDLDRGRRAVWLVVLPDQPVVIDPAHQEEAEGRIRLALALLMA